MMPSSGCCLPQCNFKWTKIGAKLFPQQLCWDFDCACFFLFPRRFGFSLTKSLLCLFEILPGCWKHFELLLLLILDTLSDYIPAKQSCCTFCHSCFLFNSKSHSLFIIWIVGLAIAYLRMGLCLLLKAINVVAVITWLCQCGTLCPWYGNN